MENIKCKICRRQGAKLFLKGDRCIGPKCALVKRPFPPGHKSKRGSRGLSEYGKELREKQKLRNWYRLDEKQFKNYVDFVLAKRGKVQDLPGLLIKKLESRLDNVVFRLGFASARSAAKQVVTHGHFSVNGRKVDIPSFEVEKGDKIALLSRSFNKGPFQKIANSLKKYQPPAWLKLDAEKMTGEIIGEPTLADAQPPAEIHLIFEFYSK